ATGLQSRFDWKGVAASALAAGVGQGLNATMDYYPGQPGVQFDLGKSLVSGLGGAIVANVARGGKISAANIAADAFGNVIGDSFAAARSSGSTYVSQEERLRDQFWEQALGPVETRSAPASQVDLFGNAPPSEFGLKLGGGIGLRVSAST